MDTLVSVKKPDYSAMPLADLDVSDPRMFQFDYWQGLFARLREQSPVHYQSDSPAGPFWSVTRYEDNGQGRGAQNARYLKGTTLIPIEGDAADRATALVEELQLGEEGLSDTERAKRIYDDVLDKMVYDKKEPGYGMGDFIRSIEVCKGNCTDFHARFMGVGRKAGLPVRFTMGIPLKAGKNTYNSYQPFHALKR